jgi:multimeric flavodoxin WrbA
VRTRAVGAPSIEKPASGLAREHSESVDGIGGSPYGPGTLAGTDGSRQPVEAELTTARNLGSRLARVAGRLKDLRVSSAATP